MENEITKLSNEYTDWLVANLPRDYIENEDCCAESLLWCSFELGLNKEQIQWLRNFCVKWEKAYLLPA